MNIPYIPEDSPFNQDQKAWLAGFMAGLQTRLLNSESSGSGRSKPPIHILYGSQTGNAEGLARTAAASAKQHGLEPVVQSLDEVELEALGKMRRVIVVTSTYGEGEMPDNAELFWEAVSSPTAPRMEEMTFGVLAIGDTGYDGFCEAGKLLDMRFEQLGAHRLLARVDCDVDFEEPANAWIEAALPLFAEVEGGPDEVVEAQVADTEAPAASAYNRKNPYPSTLAVNRRLSGAASGKEIRHYEFDLGDSGIRYEAGDALNVIPENDPALVDLLLQRLGTGADTAIAKQDKPLADLLTRNFEISTPSRELIAAIGQRAGHEELSRLLESGDKEALDNWLWGKDVLDLLHLNPGLALSADEFVSLLKPLQHRAYSISSSSLANPGRIHLTIASVRYSVRGRQRGGVCSTYLADRVAEGGQAGIFVSTNKSFRVPADQNAPVIMVGPGTGIAPFRAFLQERQASGASGRNWLFFGDQTRSSDFIYEDELTSWMKDGVLGRLDLAFSRDQSEKIYVQTRMRENGKELYAWLQDGGHFYVCGDASRMAKDVDRALHDLVAEHGGLDADGAVAYVNQLKRDKRYLRDVY